MFYLLQLWVCHGAPESESWDVILILVIWGVVGLEWALALRELGDEEKKLEDVNSRAGQRQGCEPTLGNTLPKEGQYPCTGTMARDSPAQT